MEAWSNFFVGELGAAAALAGLLFVSLSVNQPRILALGRIANRGGASLAILFMALLAASVALIPQPGWVLGLDLLLLALAAGIALARLQRSYLRGLEAVHRRQANRVVRLEWAAVCLLLAAGVLLVLRMGNVGLYPLAASILLGFLTAGLNAWVLLIEINR